ncbi:MAG: hypothetical protein ACE5OR_08585 [bacterium]
MKTIEESLHRARIEVAAPGLSIQYVPEEGELVRCFGFGRELAEKVKTSSDSKLK